MVAAPVHLPSGTATAVGLAVVVAAALAVVLAQPLDAPWWYHADADATYVANSYELGAGYATWYLDHPGMPLQDLMAVTFETRYLAYRLHGGSASRRQYLNERLLNLDDSRVYFRAYAALFYLLGAIVAFFVVRGMLRSTLWAVGSGLLWLGAPGLLEQSIQYRADPLLAALVLLVGFLIVRSAERRDPFLYVLSTLALGFTITVKVHAAALVVPLGIALALRPPRPSWREELTGRVRALPRRALYLLALFGAGWLVLVVVFNSSRFPSTTGPWRYPDGLQTTAEIRRLVIEIVVALVAYTILSSTVRRTRRPLVRRLADPFVALLLWVLLAGILIPGTLSIHDGFAMLLSIRNGLTGGGVNSSANVTPFVHGWGDLIHWPVQQFLPFFGLAAVAAAVGIRRRELGPALWFAGAAVAALFAAARFGTKHYWAPAYVLSIPPALWLCRRMGAAGSVVAAALLLYVLSFAGLHVRDGTHRASSQARSSVAWTSLADRLIKPGEVAIGPAYVGPVADIPYVDLVRLWVAAFPPRTYRFVSARDQGLQIAAAQHSKVAYYFGPLALGVDQVKTLELIPGRDYVVGPLVADSHPALGFGVLRLLHGPGVDRPYDHPGARYDPWTGAYKEGVHYYTLYGDEIRRPPRRQYLATAHLWEDAAGRLWSADGARVKPRP